MKKLLLILFITPFASQAQLSKQDSVWLPFTNMMGTWIGTSEGQPGKGTYERSYHLVLNKNSLR